MLILPQAACAQPRIQVVDQIASRFLAWEVLDKARLKTIGIPGLRLDLPIDLKIGIALRSSDLDLVSSRLSFIKLGLAIAHQLTKDEDYIRSWLKNRGDELASRELQESRASLEITMNRSFSPEAASSAVQAQAIIRAGVGQELEAFERDFRAALAAVLSKSPGLGEPFLRGDDVNQDLTNSRIQIGKLLTAAGKK